MCESGIRRDWQIHDQGEVGDKIISTRGQRSRELVAQDKNQQQRRVAMM